jgi:Zn-dependent protease
MRNWMRCWHLISKWLSSVLIQQRVLPMSSRFSTSAHKPSTLNHPPRTLNFVLFFLTLVSVWYVGMTSYFSYALHQGILTPDQLFQDVPLLGTTFSVFNWVYWWRGLPYALSILAILGGHELGHYFVARYHRVATSLPYFIPLPFGIIGTMGAVINLRAPIKNRRVLLDIAVAGPLVGVLIAVPILFYGLATSTVTYSTEGGLIEGNSILYAVAKIAILGEFYPNGEMDVFINQMAWAGWVGLLVTAFNLVPISQLDGGRILRAYLGEKAHTLHMPFLLRSSPSWLPFPPPSPRCGWFGFCLC